MKLRPARLIVVIVALLSATLAFAAPRQVPMSELFPSPAQTKSAVVINKVLERYHYRKVNIDNAFAQGVLEGYLKALDPNRSFFLERDVERFKGGARRLEDGLRRGELDLAFDIFRVYRMRVDERVQHALRLLEHDFDFDRDESFQLESPDVAWAKDSADTLERQLHADVEVFRSAGRHIAGMRFQCLGVGVDEGLEDILPIELMGPPGQALIALAQAIPNVFV
jgi:carboxyl-terminal processing protease